jgi:hypothetical protein
VSIAVTGVVSWLQRTLEPAWVGSSVVRRCHGSVLFNSLTAQVLKDFLPVDATLNATTIQNHTLAVAQRCEPRFPF